MKIISKFQDYYDIGISYGIDEKLRFIRETYTISDKDTYGSYTIHRYRKGKHNFRATFYYNYIGFCGEIYPFIHIHIEKTVRKNKLIHYLPEHSIYSYSIDEFEKNLSLYVVPSEEIVLPKKWVGKHWKRRNILDKVNNFFITKNTEIVKLFKIYKKAYFVVEHYCIFHKNKVTMRKKIIVLPKLKQYKFVKVVPPMQAFQEISMYLGALDLVEDRTVTIDDKYLAQGKGFDCYSFKKMPSKRIIKKC